MKLNKKNTARFNSAIDYARKHYNPMSDNTELLQTLYREFDITAGWDYKTVDRMLPIIAAK